MLVFFVIVCLFIFFFFLTFFFFLVSKTLTYTWTLHSRETVHIAVLISLLSLLSQILQCMNWERKKQHSSFFSEKHRDVLRKSIWETVNETKCCASLAPWSIAVKGVNLGLVLVKEKKKMKKNVINSPNLSWDESNTYKSPWIMLLSSDPLFCLWVFTE